MGDVHQETGLMIIVVMIAISATVGLYLRSLLGISIEQVTILIWAALISGSVVGGGIFTVLYKYDRWVQLLAASVAGVTTPLIGSGIWLNTTLSIRWSMVSGGLLAVVGLYLGRAAVLAGLDWLVKRSMS